MADFPIASIVVCIANGMLIAGIGTPGMLALSANIYQVAIRSTGGGWGMGSGGFGEVIIPLLVGVLMTTGGGRGETAFMVIAAIPFVGALAMFLLGRHSSRLRTAHASG